MNSYSVIRRFASTPLILILSALILGGCLSAERKEYIYKVNPDGSGTGKIIFHNIMSVEEDSTDKSLKDYSELVSDYYKGKRFEMDHGDYINVKKRLFEENGKLSGEITFEFKNYADVGLYRFKGKGPWMYAASQFSGFSTERLDTTALAGAAFGGEKMPVLFWDENVKEFKITTQMDKPDRKTRSLLSLYKRIGTE